MTFRPSPWKPPQQNSPLSVQKKKRPREGGNQKRKNLDPWRTSWKAVEHRCWYKEKINFYCDNWHFKVYVSPISMSLVNIPAIYHCFANEVTGSKVKNWLNIIQKQVKELEDTQNSALIHSINCLTPSYWAKSYSAQSLLFKAFSSSAGVASPTPRVPTELIIYF